MSHQKSTTRLSVRSPMPSDLEGLLERVNAAKGPDREIDARIWCHFEGKRFKEAWTGYRETTQVYYTEPPGRKLCVSQPDAIAPVSSSVDAALGLVERMLPGCDWFIEMSRDYRQPYRVLVARDDYCSEAADHLTAPLCILAALLTALIEQRKAESKQGEG